MQVMASGVISDRVRQNHRMRHRVRKCESAAEGMAELVMKGHADGLERGPRKKGAEKRLLVVVREALGEDAYGLFRHEGYNGILVLRI